FLSELKWRNDVRVLTKRKMVSWGTLIAIAVATVAAGLVTGWSAWVLWACTASCLCLAIANLVLGAREETLRRFGQEPPGVAPDTPDARARDTGSPS
ncbi:MAG: hypothetical protein ACTJGR_06625, partial [Pauljensenia sp.]